MPKSRKDKTPARTNIGKKEVPNSPTSISSDQSKNSALSVAGKLSRKSRTSRASTKTPSDIALNIAEGTENYLPPMGRGRPSKALQQEIDRLKKLGWKEAPPNWWDNHEPPVIHIPVSEQKNKTGKRGRPAKKRKEEIFHTKTTQDVSTLLTVAENVERMRFFVKEGKAAEGQLTTMENLLARLKNTE